MKTTFEKIKHNKCMYTNNSRVLLEKKNTCTQMIHNKNIPYINNMFISSDLYIYKERDIYIGS